MVKDYQKIGSKGGKASPNNFRNNRELASAAGKLSKPSAWPQCPACSAKMAESKLAAHIAKHRRSAPGRRLLAQAGL